MGQQLEAIAQGHGGVAGVLLETRLESGLWEGYTANYTPVRVAGPEGLQGRLLPVRLTAAGEDWCLGELAENV